MASIALLDLITALRMAELDAANIPADIDTLKTRTGRVCLFKDQWCATPIPSQALTNAGADISWSNVVFPAGFLPAGAVIQAIYLLFKWRKQVDSSGAANAISAANKTIRVKKNAGAIGTAIVGITFANGQLHTAMNMTEGGDMIIGDVDVSGVVDDVDNETYNLLSNQTTHADCPVVTAASLTLYDIYTGLRVYYTLA